LINIRKRGVQLVTPEAYYKVRDFKDKVAKHLIRMGGLSVIFAVVLIFFYLLYVTLPIFESAKMNTKSEYALNLNQSEILAMDVEEYGEIGFVVTKKSLFFFDIANGSILSETSLVEDYGNIVAVSSVLGREGTYVLAFEDGHALVIDRKYKITYPNNKRFLTPQILFPFGEDSISISGSIERLTHVEAQLTDTNLKVVIQTLSGEVWFKKWSIEESFLTGGVSLEEEDSVLVTRDGAEYLMVTPNNDWVYTVNDQGKLSFFEIDDGESNLLEALSVGSQGAKVTAANLLLGGISIMIADSSGVISQYFPVRNNAQQYAVKFIRSFEQENGDITNIVSEVRRKSFIATTSQGEVGLYHSTAHRSLLSQKMVRSSIDFASVSAPGTILIVSTKQGQVSVIQIKNEHPDISWSALWGQIWYESYPEPDYIWQSSSSSNDFEAKFSFMPLSFGTLKAAFYAMLMAMPLAICGAIFTAYFMAPKMRQYVKPIIEVMEALPTVILGFLAGLWLAPLIEEKLGSIFLLLIMMPLGIVGFGIAWTYFSEKMGWEIAEGWEGGLLIPVVVLITVLTFWVGPSLEAVFFDDSLRNHLQNEHDISYDQRNAMVVGIAMGFAVIPTIFSITEDAIFSVPKHLTNGSLALGASRWQTMMRVILPTASPGIFSAVMIGMGRAVGETMIVLMATGNTPIMDANIFEGMRTLSANIAVEMPESEVGSTHYRVLFLAALVLFAFTFVFNTVAEVVRQRLRQKYGSL
jgi:phosphate transport system permease protein